MTDFKGLVGSPKLGTNVFSTNFWWHLPMQFPRFWDIHHCIHPNKMKVNVILLVVLKSYIKKNINSNMSFTNRALIKASADKQRERDLLLKYIEIFKKTHKKAVRLWVCPMSASFPTPTPCLCSQCIWLISCKHLSPRCSNNKRTLFFAIIKSNMFELS